MYKLGRDGMESEKTVAVELTAISSLSDEEAAKIDYTALVDVEELKSEKKGVRYGVDGQTNGRFSPAPGNTKDTRSKFTNKSPLLSEALFGGEVWVKVWKRVELGLLSVLIVVVCSLLSLPVVFYHLPNQEVSAFS